MSPVAAAGDSVVPRSLTSLGELHYGPQLFIRRKSMKSHLTHFLLLGLERLLLTGVEWRYYETQPLHR